jgi:hypothetical protein
MKRDTEKKMTIEDLLRLKRAERPPTEFWAKFESEMRAKQLAAIVVRRPWWDRATPLLAFVNRRHLSFGAVAALALTWAGIHYVGAPAPIVDPAPSKAPRRALAASVETLRPAALAKAPNEEILVASAQLTPLARPVAMASASHVTPAPVTVPELAPARTPFGEGVAITLADFRAAGTEVARRDVFGSDREFESMAPASQPISEPLARMDPSAERRARLLAPGLPAFSSASTHALASDWMKTRAANERMYESMDLSGSTDRPMVGFRF